jgi:hypothetical protein
MAFTAGFGKRPTQLIHLCLQAGAKDASRDRGKGTRTEAAAGGANLGYFVEE